MIPIHQIYSIKYLSIFTIIIVISISVSPIFRDILYFRDYAITYEGALRLSLGQFPYYEFGLPIGPFSYLLPALLFKLFGAEWVLLNFLQSFYNLIINLLIFKIIGLFTNNIKIICVCLISNSFFFVIFLTHPTYNIFSILLLLFLIYYLLKSNNLNVFILALVSFCILLTKQDFGIMAIIFVSLYLQNIKRILKFFINIIILSILTYLVFDENIIFWINFGQGDHNLPYKNIIDFTSLHFILATILFVFFIINISRKLINSNLLFLFTSIIFISYITSKTSGLFFTHFYYSFCIPFIIYQIYNDFNKKYFISFIFKIILISLFMGLLIKPSILFYKLISTHYLGHYEHFFFDYKSINYELIKSGRKINNSNIIISDDTAFLNEYIFTKRKISDFKILNISELSFLYNNIYVPPVNIQLWFHEGITIHEKNKSLILNKIRHNYDLIIIQGAHEGNTEFYKSLINELNKNENYINLNNSGYNSPACVTLNISQCNHKFYVFERIN